MATNKDARILCAIFQKIYQNHRERSPPLDIFGRTIRIKKMKEKSKKKVRIAEPYQNIQIEYKEETQEETQEES